MKCDPLSPRQKPSFPPPFAGCGASPLDAIFQRRSEQISVVHSAAFMESRSLVLGDSFMRCQRRPLTGPAPRTFELRTSPWRLIHAVPCLFHPPGCQNWHEHPSSSLQLGQGTPSAFEASPLTVENETAKSRQIPRTPVAWENSLRGETWTSSNSCHHSTNMTTSRHMGEQSASILRPPWDSSIYRDPLAKAAPDKEGGNRGDCEAFNSDEAPADGGLHSGVLTEAHCKNTECSGSHALTAEKGVQCDQPRFLMKLGTWCARRQAWVPPGVHIVNVEQRRSHGNMSGVQRHGRRTKTQPKTAPAHLPKRSQRAQPDAVGHRKRVSAVKGYEPAARAPLMPLTYSLQNGSTLVSPDIEVHFSRAQRMGNHSLAGTANAPNACHAQARLRGAKEERTVQKSMPSWTGLNATSRSMRQDSQPIQPPQRRQEKSAGLSAREAAARKLLEQLELETADSLNELERLVEEEHRQLVASGVLPADTTRPLEGAPERLAVGRSCSLQEVPDEGGSVRGAALCQMGAALEEAMIR